ncbi:MAG: hypothetical protein PHC75_07970 [Burkholderiales bacterium]|jgi:hypothetical protein|nr:hypothetical protein [Burkholderiales bacterium]
MSNKFTKPMIIKQLIESVPNENLHQDSMVVNFAVSTKEPGVREEKIYMDLLKPEECKLKVRNAMLMRNYTNLLIEAPNTLLEQPTKE